MVVTKVTVGRGVTMQIPENGVIQQKDEKMIRAGWDVPHQLNVMKTGNALTNVIPKTIQSNTVLNTHFS